MTNQQINAAIAEITGSNKLVGLKKRGLWWRHEAHGYTHNESEAWCTTEEEAKKYARPNDIYPVTIERFHPIDYCNDLNAMHKAIMEFDNETIARIDSCLTMLFDPEEGNVLHKTINATARQRAEAFLRALGKWEEVKL